jgi:hypothetical protein
MDLLDDDKPIERIAAGDGATDLGPRGPGCRLNRAEEPADLFADLQISNLRDLRAPQMT